MRDEGRKERRRRRGNRRHTAKGLWEDEQREKEKKENDHHLLLWSGHFSSRFHSRVLFNSMAGWLVGVFVRSVAGRCLVLASFYFFVVVVSLVTCVKFTNKKLSSSSSSFSLRGLMIPVNDAINDWPRGA